LTKIRGKTVSYALYRKKEKMKLENCFVEDIMKLENELHTTENFDLIEKKKSDQYMYLFLNKGFHNKSLLLVKFDSDQLLHFQIHRR
jgi:hypothetical protein